MNYYEITKECFQKDIFKECNQKFNFQKYVENNPEIVDLFFKYTIEAIKSGARKISSELIVNRIRWQISVVTHQEDKYKINNNSKPYLSRLFTYVYKEHIGVFNTRDNNKNCKDEQY